ncbi:hypothetical protein F1654_13150 [Alkalicaulis satelles]|uniref:Type II toxin-antitoxin system HicA family toxin n=1 Tax=Alkalicaulis satelles TaxID=2609175 RepID=A0A5M6ZA65_9PROT|nr:hypothetical protein [Alkalicaulis satelles]KAA5801000.1 hypothetical protein F1654_13150 [Alkalicaulis satelles]
MNGKEFIRRARAYACAQDLPFEVSPERGKGGHQLIRVGARPTTVKSGEIGTGLLHKMLRDPAIPKDAF